MKFRQQHNTIDIDFDTAQVMGVLNITPDSFSDGGAFFSGAESASQQINIAAAVDHAELMVNAGATFIDVGGESTRPGASAVPLQQELDRVIPVVEAIAAKLDCIISVDTSSPQVMQEAASCGAGLLNDVRAFQRDGALEAAAQSQLPLCLMHMRGEPETMQQQPRYESVVDEVLAFLLTRIKRCEAANIDRDRLIVDPGFGFGKTLAHNLSMLQQLSAFRIDDIPVLVGISRKSMLGTILQSPDGVRDVNDRLYGGLSAVTIAVLSGAKIIRTHDVGPTCDAVKVAQAVMSAKG